MRIGFGKKRFRFDLVKRICFLILVPALISGCVYSKVIFPLDKDVNQTELGDKVGRSSSHSVLWLVAWGDGGLDAAAKDGDLKAINHLDVERFVLLFGTYVRVTTIAYGN